MIIPLRKQKVIVTPGEMKKIESIKKVAKLSTSPAEVRMYRKQMNSIINQARVRK